MRRSRDVSVSVTDSVTVRVSRPLSAQYVPAGGRTVQSEVNELFERSEEQTHRYERRVPMTRIRSLATLAALALAASLAAYSCGGGGGGNGGGSPTDPPPRPAQVHTVTIRENSYEPKSITIEPGDTVRWVFSGIDPNHTVTAVNGAFDSG